MIFKFRSVTFILLFVICILQYSCFTIKYSTTGASIPVEAKTFSVQFFDNQAQALPSVPMELTNSLRNYIISNTKLQMVNGVGDLDFEGAITGYEERPVAISGDEIQVTKNRFTITVKVKFTNPFNEELSYEASFSRFEEYSISTSFSQAQAQYTTGILELLIEDIFNKAFANW